MLAWWLCVSGNTAACAQSPPTPALSNTVKSALFAKVTGFGGCDDVGRVIARQDVHYPGITFVDCACIAEHGDTARTTIATDSGGQVYLLDSPASRNFMLRMHPGRRFGREDAVDYVASALGMMGVRTPWDSVIKSSSSIPDEVLTSAGIKRSHLWDSTRVKKDFKRGFEVTVLLISSRSIKSISALVYSDTGVVTVMTDDRWLITGT